MDKKVIEEFARKYGYKTAVYLCKWNGYDCYEPIAHDEGISCMGLPILILVDIQGNIRMSTPEEALQQIDEAD